MSDERMCLCGPNGVNPWCMVHSPPGVPTPNDLGARLARAEKLLEEAATMLIAAQTNALMHGDDCAQCRTSFARFTGWLSRYEAEKRHDG